MIKLECIGICKIINSGNQCSGSCSLGKSASENYVWDFHIRESSILEIEFRILVGYQSNNHHEVMSNKSVHSLKKWLHVGKISFEGLNDSDRGHW